MLFHPHAGATCTTAESGITVAIHLHQIGTRCTDQLAGSFEDLVVAAQETRIVVGHGLAGVWGGYGLQAVFPDQFVQQLSVVHNFVVATHVWVFIAQGVEAVRTRHNDLALLRRHALERLIQHLNVLFRQHLEEELITCSTCRITRTTFALTQHGELHASGVQQVSHCAGGLGGVVVIHTSTADPEQVLGVIEVLNVLAVHGDINSLGLGLLDPLCALVVVLTPRISLGLHVLEQATQLGGEI